MVQSQRLFEGICSADAEVAWNTYGYSAFREVRDAASDGIDPSVVALADYGFRDVRQAVENLLVYSRYQGSLEERIALVTNPRSVRMLGFLAARSEESMAALISNTTTYGSRLRLDHTTEGDSLGITDVEAGMAKAEDSPRCLFAGYIREDGEERRSSPLFEKFASWSAQMAVHFDDESYQRRMGLK